MDMVFIPCPNIVNCWICLKLVLVVDSMKFVNESKAFTWKICNLLKENCTWIYRFGTNHDSTNLFCRQTNYPTNCFILRTSFHNVCVLTCRDPPDAARFKQPKNTDEGCKLCNPSTSRFNFFILPLRHNILFNTLWNTFIPCSSLNVTGK